MSGRTIVVWIVLVLAEILHCIARGVLLVPYVGEFRSNQIGVFTGSVIIFAIALAFDYNVLEGGLLPFGFVVLILSPLLAGKVRGVT